MRRLPLRHHLVALVVLAVLPVLLFAGMILDDLAGAQRRSVERGLERSVRALATAVEREIAASVRALEVLASSPELTRADLRGFHAHAVGAAEAQDLWYVVALTRPDGRLLLSSLRPFGAPLPSIEGRDYFDRLVATGEPVVSDLIAGRTTGWANVTVAVPVVRDGALRYILFAAIDPDAFGRILAAQGIPADWIAGVTDTRHVIIARTRDPARFVGRELIEPVSRAVSAAAHGSGRFPVYDSQDVYAAWHRLPSLGWTVTLGAPVALVEAPLRQSLLMLAAAGLLVVLVGGGLAVFWGRLISGAMRGLASAAAEVGGGRVPAHCPSTIEEVDAVGRALETAAATIASQTAALVASQARIRRLVDSNLVGIVFGDGRRIVDANDAFLRMVGAGGHELRAGTLVWHGETPACCAVDAAPAGQTEWPVCEGEYVRHDNTRVPILVGGALLDPVGPKWVAFVLDITEHKRAGEERRLRNQAEAANRAKDEFLAILSHELRTPLTAILAWTQLLRTGRLADGQAAEALDRIERSARLQTRIVDDLLDVSRIVAGKLTITRAPVLVASIVQDAVAALGREAASRGVALRTRFDAPAAVVLGDGARLQQVVLNLVGNAIKFTGSGGDVEVAVAQADARVLVTVRDTGEGIDSALLPHVFERFRQGEGAGDSHSLGLGLAIVRHLVELHGGSVRAESPGPGGGAVLTVDLPAQVADGKGAAAGSSLTPSSHGPSRRG